MNRFFQIGEQAAYGIDNFLFDTFYFDIVNLVRCERLVECVIERWFYM